MELSPVESQDTASPLPPSKLQQSYIKTSSRSQKPNFLYSTMD